MSSPTTMLLLWYPILDTICDMCGVEKDTDLKRSLLLGVYISAMGAYVLPFKGIHLACTMQLSGGGNATVLGVATILSAMCAFMTNGAIAYATVLPGREEMTNKFIFTKGLVTNGIYIVVASVICIVFGYIM